MSLRPFDLAFATAVVYLVIYLAVGIRLRIKGDAASNPQKGINFFSLWPADLFKAVGFLLFSWPKDLVTRYLVVTARVLFVVYFVFFFQAVSEPRW